MEEPAVQGIDTSPRIATIPPGMMSHPAPAADCGPGGSSLWHGRALEGPPPGGPRDT